jgi:hypothetical protein
MKNIKDFLITESTSQNWSAKEVYDFVNDIIHGDHGDAYYDSEWSDYYDEKEKQLKHWLKNNKSTKFICKTSTPDYWEMFDSSHKYIKVKSDYIDDIDGPEENCGLYIGAVEIEGKAVPVQYGANGDDFDFVFEEV